MFTPFKLTLGDQVHLCIYETGFGKLNEAGFDLRKYLFSERIVANATYQAGTSFSIHSSTNLRAFDGLKVTLTTIQPQLDNSDLIVALSFGYREFIQSQRWICLRAVGLFN
ncbi:hypothetical protein O9992_15665 [Vibrio lentus]|nr:hypothetical protein [Vibrio lentus]